MLVQIANDEFADFVAAVRKAGNVTGVFYRVPSGPAKVFAFVNGGSNVVYMNGTFGVLTQAVVLAEFPDAIETHGAGFTVTDVGTSVSM